MNNYLLKLFIKFIEEANENDFVKFTIKDGKVGVKLGTNHEYDIRNEEDKF